MAVATQITHVDQVRQKNTGLLYQFIDQHAPISRTQIANINQMAPASISKITRQLMIAGLIEEKSMLGQEGKGRRAVALNLVSDAFHFLSVRLGRGYMVIGLHCISGALLAQSRITLEELAQEAVAQRFVQELIKFQRAHKSQIKHLFAVAVTLPGLIDPDEGVIEQMPHFDIRQFEFRAFLEQALQLPVYISNDIRAWALAEHYFGASQNCKDSVLIFVHHGTGAGIIVNGELLLGENKNMGEIGHIQIDPFGKQCHCGNYGCVETIASNQAVEKKVKTLLDKGYPSKLSHKTANIQTICEAANQGDFLAEEVIKELAASLGQVIAMTVNLFNPEKILIGGELVASKGIIFPLLKASLDRQCLSSYTDNLSLEAATFYDTPTLPGVAIIKQALYSGTLLDTIVKGH